MWLQSAFRLSLFSLITLLLSSCYKLPMSPSYEGPPERPAEMDTYYSKEESYGPYTEEITKERSAYSVKRIEIESSAGDITIDYYFQDEPNDDLVLVFPVLGGRPVLSKYFAKYFARQGLDSAVIARVNDFKNPDNFMRLEEILRRGVVRDRIAIDFFEKEYGKKDFGTFGLSRGAINVAISAGIDPRLKYNVMAMGGSGMVEIFRDSKERRIRKFINKVMADRGFTEDELFHYLETTIFTDPVNTAQFIDARDSMVIVSTCDTTVPYKNGLKLRDQIGRPETIVLYGGHRSSVFFTQFLPLLPPWSEVCIFPFDYVETEATHFLKKKFDRGTTVTTLKLLPFRILRAIPSGIATVVSYLTGNL